MSMDSAQTRRAPDGTPVAPCWCCGEPAPIRGDGDPWEGRMDGYCESCAITRCDTTDSACAVGQVTSWVTSQVTSPRGLCEALEEEADALGLMSYHGIGTAQNGETMWRADLAPEDVGEIRALISLAASELARRAAALPEAPEGVL